MRGGGEEKKGGISRIRPPPTQAWGDPWLPRAPPSVPAVAWMARKGVDASTRVGKGRVCVRVCLCARDRGIETSEAPCGLGQHF